MKQSVAKKLLVSSLIFSTILVFFGLTIFEPKIANAQLSDSANFGSSGGNGNVMPTKMSGLGAMAGADIKLGKIATSIVDCGATAIKNYIFNKAAAKVADKARDRAIAAAENTSKLLKEAETASGKAKGASNVLNNTSFNQGSATTSIPETLKSTTADLSKLTSEATASTAEAGLAVSTIKGVYNNSDQLSEAESAFNTATSNTAKIASYLAASKGAQSAAEGAGLAAKLIIPSVPTDDETTRASLGQHITELNARLYEVKREIVSVENVAKQTKDQQLKVALRESCMRGIANAVAKTLLRQITIKTIDWINSGFEGKPFYLDKPGVFLEDIGKKEIAGFVSSFDKDSLKFPFGRAAAIEIINNFNHNYFENNAAFTLNNVVRDDIIKGFYGNFSMGGWNQWISLTQFPQNNPIGFRMMASDELAARTSGSFPSIAEIAKDELSYYSGFLSLKGCVKSKSTNEVYSKPQGAMTELDYLNAANTHQADLDYMLNDKTGIYTKKDIQSVQLDKDIALGHVCAPDGMETQTPGTFIANQLNQFATNSPLHQMELADDINKSLAAIFDALLNQGIDYGIRKLQGDAGNDSWVQGITTEPQASNLRVRDNNPGGQDINTHKTFVFEWTNGGDLNAFAQLEVSTDPDFIIKSPQVTFLYHPSPQLANLPNGQEWAEVVAPIQSNTPYFVRARVCPSTGCLATGASNVLAINETDEFSFPYWTTGPKTSPFNNPSQTNQPNKHYFTFSFEVTNGGLETQTAIEVNNSSTWKDDPKFPIKTIYGPTISASATNETKPISITIPIVDDGISGYKDWDNYYARARAINGRGSDYNASVASGFQYEGHFIAVDADLPVVTNFVLGTSIVPPLSLTNNHADFTVEIEDGGLLTTASLYIDTVQANLPSTGTGALLKDIETVYGGDNKITLDADLLLPNTIYWAEVKATNSKGDAYSAQITFTTTP